MATTDRPHGTTIAALKGIAIAATLLRAGQLGTVTLNLPSLYSAVQYSPRSAANRFAHQYKVAKATGAPAEIGATLICSGLALLGYRDHRGSIQWKLWAAAAGFMAAMAPWAIAFMEAPSRKLLWVSEVADTATIMPSSGIGVQVTGASPKSSGSGAGMLGIPTNKKPRDGAITPMEDFEPFEDAPMDEREYEQLKVVKLLKQYNYYNGVRALMPFAAGVLALWATLSE